MTTFAYLFEAKSIQAYILDSGKLRDLVGASELIDSLCGAPLDDALRALGIESAARFSRRAGGAFYIFSENADTIGKLAAYWPLVVQQYAPSLDFDQGRGSGENEFAAYESARTALSDDRSRARVSLPQAGPRVHRSQRTGRPAVDSRSRDGQVELLDAATRRQRRYNRPEKSSLLNKLTPDGSGLGWKDWPLDLSASDAVHTDDEEPKARAFPFRGDDRYIAVLHADGNGLGQLLLELRKHTESRPNQFIDVFKRLSDGISEATQSAVRQAVQEVLLPIRDKEGGLIPARPIVLGGDDLTMILRADLALPFARVFLKAFEQDTRPVMEWLSREHGIDELGLHLSACAGIAYIKASQPFYLAARLAEGITGAVKRQAKAVDSKLPPGSLGFHRVTTAMIDDYSDVIKRELTTGNPSGRYCHTLGAYAIDANLEDKTLPALDDLLALQRVLQDPAMARGPARQILGLIAHAPAQAEVRYRRWCSLMGDKNRGRPELLDAFNEPMGRLLPEWKRGDLPYRKLSEQERSVFKNVHWAGPLGDLHALMSVDNQLPEQDISEERAP